MGIHRNARRDLRDDRCGIGAIVWAFEVEGFWQTIGVLLIGLPVARLHRDAADRARAGASGDRGRRRHGGRPLADGGRRFEELRATRRRRRVPQHPLAHRRARRPHGCRDRLRARLALVGGHAPDRGRRVVSGTARGLRHLGAASASSSSTGPVRPSGRATCSTSHRATTASRWATSRACRSIGWGSGRGLGFPTGIDSRVLRTLLFTDLVDSHDSGCGARRLPVARAAVRRVRGEPGRARAVRRPGGGYDG